MRKRQAKRPPTFTTDEGGQPVALVALANGRVAMIDVPDLDYLMESGVTLNWNFHDNGKGCAYVRAKGRDNGTVSIARFITEADKRQQVRYANGDRTDLRWANLRLESGGVAKSVARITQVARQYPRIGSGSPRQERG